MSFAVTRTSQRCTWHGHLVLHSLLAIPRLSVSNERHSPRDVHHRRCTHTKSNIVNTSHTEPHKPPIDLHSLNNLALRKLWLSLATSSPSPSVSSSKPTLTPVDPGMGRRPHFVYYDVSPRCQMGPKLCHPLDVQEMMLGRLYIFRRASSPDYVKIGWTAHAADHRLRHWSKSCGYDAVLVHSTPLIPHAKRAELLVHEQLAWERRRERLCEGCGKAHIEWFKMEGERAAKVVDDWAALIVRAKEQGDGVYDEHGKIRDDWARAVFALLAMRQGRAGQAAWAGEVTAEMLQESYDKVQGSKGKLLDREGKKSSRRARRRKKAVIMASRTTTSMVVKMQGEEEKLCVTERFSERQVSNTKQNSVGAKSHRPVKAGQKGEKQHLAMESKETTELLPSQEALTERSMVEKEMDAKEEKRRDEQIANKEHKRPSMSGMTKGKGKERSLRSELSQEDDRASGASSSLRGWFTGLLHKLW